jgi:hypothetical protein
METLPIEMFGNILTSLPCRDVKHLRQSCKYFLKNLPQHIFARHSVRCSRHSKVISESLMRRLDSYVEWTHGRDLNKYTFIEHLPFNVRLFQSWYTTLGREWGHVNGLQKRRGMFWEDWKDYQEDSEDYQEDFDEESEDDF